MKIGKKALAGIALAAIAILATAYWRIHQTRATLLESFPGMPQSSLGTPGFQERLDSSYRSLQNGFNPSDSAKAIASLFHSNGFLDEAQTTYDALMRAEPGNARWPHLKAVILAGYGILEDAEKLWRRSIELDGTYLPSRIQLGNALIKQRKWDDARVLLSDTLATWPNEPYSLLGLGRIAFETGDLQAARSHLEAALEHSDRRVGVELLGTVYQNLGETGRASALRGATNIGTYPQLMDPWLLDSYEYSYDGYMLSIMGGHAAFGGDTDTGVAFLRKAIALEPENQMLHYQLGILQADTRDFAEAERAFRTCVRLQPDFSDAWLQLVELSRVKGDARGAMQTLATAYKNCPDSPGILLELATLKNREGQWEESIPLYRKSIKLRPNEAPAYLGLATALSSMGRARESIQEMEKALKVEPANPTALSTAAFWAILNGDEAKARDYLRRIEAQPLVSSRDRTALLQKFSEQFGAAYRSSD